jgi:Mn2+/Fe2+ NRAMP family transporter
VNRVTGPLVALVVPGTAGAFVTAILGFEEPSNILLLVSSILALAAPVAVLIHLAVTNQLTRHEKRVWLRHLAGSRAPSAFAAYLTADDRRATVRKLADAEAVARRNSQQR